VSVEVGSSEHIHDTEDSDGNNERVRDGSDQAKTRDKGLSDNGWESEELFSFEDSDNETKHNGIRSCGCFWTFKKPKSMADYKWEVGTTIVDKAQFVDGVRTYVVHAGMNLKYDKNDKQGKCDWSLYCGFLVSCQT